MRIDPDSPRGLLARTHGLRDADLGPLAATLCGVRDIAADQQHPELAAWLAEAATLVAAERLRRRREIRDLEKAAGRDTKVWWGDPADVPEAGAR